MAVDVDPDPVELLGTTTVPVVSGYTFLTFVLCDSLERSVEIDIDK